MTDDARLHELEKWISRAEARIIDLEEAMDTFVKTPWWKRLWLLFLGWPLYRLVDHPQWRPWPISRWQKSEWERSNG